MTAFATQALVLDLIGRTEMAVEAVAHLAKNTAITFRVGDVVNRVERGLPDGYPAPTAGEMTRRDVIAEMARDILSGEMYQEV